MKSVKAEVWQRGPVEGVPALLQPVAHALLQAREEVTDIMKDCPEHLLWLGPAGLASVGFHLQHLSGVLDRLFTYARGCQLNDKQLHFLSIEGQPQANSKQLLMAFQLQVDHAIQQLKDTHESTLLNNREVGRKKVPSNVIGLLFHAAEHTMRHTGQLLVTVKIVSSNNNNIPQSL